MAACMGLFILFLKLISMYLKYQIALLGLNKNIYLYEFGINLTMVTLFT